MQLKRRPVGTPVADDFALATVEVPSPGPGEVQVRNLWMAVDPAMRGRMKDAKSYVPPFALHAAVPTLLAASWTMLREALVEAHVDRFRKEVVATAVSRANACTYCVDAHSAALHALGDAATADALAAGSAPLVDPVLAPLVAWAAATRIATDPALRRPPFGAAEAPELIAIALCFHYVNRVVAIFLAPSPMPVASARLKGWLRRALGPVLGGTLTQRLAPGASLDFLPRAALPDDLAWARPHPVLADALGRAARAFDDAGTAHVPADVRALVAARVADWDGAAAPLDRRWLEDAVAPLPEAERPTARLALLTAFAPERVDDATLADCRRAGADDAALVATTAWASFTTARRLAARSAAAAVS